MTPAVGLALALLATPAPAEPGPLRFEAVHEPALDAAFTRWELGHGAAWGDVTGNGRPDLYAGSFADRPVFLATNAPTPNFLLLNTTNGFARSAQPALEWQGLGARVSHAVFADLDNDGDLDLIVATHRNRRWGPESPAGGPYAVGQHPSVIFENTGQGEFRPVPARDPWPPLIGMRNISPLDVDGDGLLDLLVCDGTYDRTSRNRFRVLRNLGQFRFEEYGAALGLPERGTHGLGLAIGDVNDDGRFDWFIPGCNRLFVSTPDGRYVEAPFPYLDGYRVNDRDGTPCAAVFADLNRDDKLDLVVTYHDRPARLFVFLNVTTNPATPAFRDVSAEAGLGRLFPISGVAGAAMKLAHVELRDMDNDGRPDIVLAALYRDDDGKPQPLVLRQLPAPPGTVRFEPPRWDRLIGYCAPAPVADFDGDGRLDLFFASWFPIDTVPTHLFRNVTPAGNFLDVRVRGDGKTRNTMGIGAIVRAYAAGQAGKPDALLARWDIAAGFGYAAGQEAAAHLGLGAATHCDLVVSWAGSNQVLRAVAANQRIVVPFGAP